jgi:hypothetical protein
MLSERIKSSTAVLRLRVRPLRQEPQRKFILGECSSATSTLEKCALKKEKLA